MRRYLERAQRRVFGQRHPDGWRQRELTLALVQKVVDGMDLAGRQRERIGQSGLQLLCAKQVKQPLQPNDGRPKRTAARCLAPNAYSGEMDRAFRFIWTARSGSFGPCVPVHLDRAHPGRSEATGPARVRGQGFFRIASFRIEGPFSTSR